MENFRRSLKYLWPYRGRLTVAIGCVIVIAVLWSGGLGMVLPFAKIMLSDEGLHGWAWNTLTQDRLGATIQTQVVAPETPPVLGQKLTIVLNIADRQSDGPAGRAGVRPGQWIVGLVKDDSPTVIRGDELAAQVARDMSAGQKVAFLLYDANSREVSSPVITLAKARTGSQLLGKVAQAVPDPGGFSNRQGMFMWLLAVAMAVTLVRAVFTFLQEYLVGTAIWRGIMDLRCENYNVVLHLPTTYFSEKGVSDATSRFIQDTNELARGQNTLLGKTLIEPAKAAGALLVALACSWQLTLLAMVAGPPAAWLIRKLGKKMHRASRRALESWSAMLAVLGETLQGIRVVKSYTMEGSERRRFFRVNRALLKQQTKMELLDSATGPTLEALGIAAAMTAAAVAGWLVFHGKMDRYVFLAWLGSLMAMFDPVRKLAKVSIKFQQADAAAKRVFDLHDTPPEPAVHNAPSLPWHSRSIEFQGVSFRYPGAVTETLKGVNLTIAAGQTVAIVGPNGSGKTTLVSLVPRLIDPAAGRILIDGLDIAAHSVRSLRRQIGLVTQDAVMFHATIADNIAYGLRRPKRQQVLQAAQKAFVDEFVAQMPNGYDTIVGEHGTTLSGGQKQRIAIARAILRDPAILIFDEAMSQVDSDSERRIHQAMAEFIKGRTTLMIAHRFATVLSADVIVVMNGGMVIDVGTHQELLERCELYSHLYRTQFVDTGAPSVF